MTEPIECVLDFSVKGLVGKGEDWSVDKERLARLAETPPSFVPARGPYGQISRHAVKLNDLQRKSGSWDYLFHPTPVPLEAA